MTIPRFDRSVRVPDHVLVRELAGESLLLNLDTEIYFGLDDVGTRMWAQLTGSPSIQVALEGLQREYGVAPETLRADLAALLSQLLERGLLEVVDGPG